MSASARALGIKGSFSKCYLCSRSDLLPMFPVEHAPVRCSGKFDTLTSPAEVWRDSMTRHRGLLDHLVRPKQHRLWDRQP